jgi:hypothetical protein
MARPSSFFVAAGFFLALAGTVRARDEERPVATAIADAIESCVDTSAIRFRVEDRRVLLEAGDTAAVSAAIVRRYPMIEQDGLAPQRLVLWRHPQFGWVYVALLVNPSKPGEVCFTATFGANRFDLSTALIEKYFGVGTAKK